MYFLDTIGALKEKIEEDLENPISVRFQVLLFNGRELENQRTLADYNISDEAVLQVEARDPDDPVFKKHFFIFRRTFFVAFLFFNFVRRID